MTLGTAILSTVSLFCVPAGAAPPADLVADTVSRESLYLQGETFEAFYERADARRETWITNFERGVAPADLLERAGAVPGTWYLLVIAVHSCSDSVNTIPYLVHLVDGVQNLEMRLIDSDVGKTVMEAHLTPDGRPATPTLVLLNDRFQEVGCFIERPTALQSWALGDGAELGSREFLEAKFAWYDADAGRQTMSAIVELMEAAGAGAIGC